MLSHCCLMIVLLLEASPEGTQCSAQDSHPRARVACFNWLSHLTSTLSTGILQRFLLDVVSAQFDDVLLSLCCYFWFFLLLLLATYLGNSRIQKKPKNKNTKAIIDESLTHRLEHMAKCWESVWKGCIRDDISCWTLYKRQTRIRKRWTVSVGEEKDEINKRQKVDILERWNHSAWSCNGRHVHTFVKAQTIWVNPNVLIPFYVPSISITLS